MGIFCFPVGDKVTSFNFTVWDSSFRLFTRFPERFIFDWQQCRSRPYNPPVKSWLQIILICFASGGLAQSLPLPPRATNAPDGDAFAQKISSLDLKQREQTIETEILAGNVPDFLRKFCPVRVTEVTGGVTNVGVFFAAPDYLAVGSDQNYFLTPISPGTAQQVAQRLECVLPTRKMVDAIYAAAEVKLKPSPIPPSAAMTTVPIFAQHNAMVRARRMSSTNLFPLGALVAGHKKDVVIFARLADAPNKVAIYGWHQTNGLPIQPLYLGHVSSWVDYSQCTRLVSQFMLVNGGKKLVAEVLADPNLCGLISDEGALTNASYATEPGPADPDGKINLPWPEQFSATSHFGEWEREIKTADEVQILVNTPTPRSFSAEKPVLLVFYALPNGNTIDQTAGKKLQPGDDWHFDIQHIAAQTRWLRQVLTNQTVVVAYLKAGNQSWPLWRKQHNDHRIVEIIDRVCGIFASNKTEVALTSHSGGGSLFFGYLDALPRIPDQIRRIALLDSDYGYDSKLHANKIKNWLAASEENHLCVLAYQDYLARLDGKPFVSENGGTWGRSHALLNDLSSQFHFTGRTNAGLETISAAQGRVEFLLMENPEQKILHTVQVERNGFIQALLSGTPHEGNGYTYFGDRAYTNWISEK
jgi:hypothetical protein